MGGLGGWGALGWGENWKDGGPLGGGSWEDGGPWGGGGTGRMGGPGWGELGGQGPWGGGTGRMRALGTSGAGAQPGAWSPPLETDRVPWSEGSWEDGGPWGGGTGRMGGPGVGGELEGCDTKSYLSAHQNHLERTLNLQKARSSPLEFQTQEIWLCCAVLSRSVVSNSL